MHTGRLNKQERCRIAVVAPASRMSPEVAERVQTLARSLYPSRTPEIIFHPQCFASQGHFAGDDDTRARAFLEVANDESCDAVWFARGGYGSCRMVEAVLCRLTEPSRRKAYVGYSDAGVLLAALYRAGFEAVAHGPWRRTSSEPGETPRLNERSPGWSIGRQSRWNPRSAAWRRQQRLT